MQKEEFNFSQCILNLKPQNPFTDKKKVFYGNDLKSSAYKAATMETNWVTIYNI